MKKFNKILIGGPAFSGKTSFLHLLDGDENLVNFNHDKIIKLYSELFVKKQIYSAKDIIGNKNYVYIKSYYKKKKIVINLEALKLILYKTSFARLESNAFHKKAPTHYSAKSFNESESNKFLFDFGKFDYDIKKNIFNKKKKLFSFEELIDIYIKSFSDNWVNKRHKRYKNFVVKSSNEFIDIQYSLKELKKVKLIYIKRDILSLVKSRSLHFQMRDSNINQEKNIDIYFRRILFSKYIDNIKKTFRKIDILKKLYKNKIYITSLEKIVNQNNKQELIKIIQFLNLKKKNLFLSHL